MIYEYRLSFTSPVHFGLEGIGQERIDHRVRSDTLWGAIIQKWLLLYHDDAEELCLDTPFTVSSCFPLVNGVSFYPLPFGALDRLIREAGQAEEPEISVKDLKKIRFAAEPLFRKITQGEPLRFEQLHLDGVFPFEEKQPETMQERKPVYNIMQRPRLCTDQLSGGGTEGAFFYCSDQYFNQGNGLFFLATFRDDETKKRFDAALRLLGDTGLGADRSIGRGMFSFETKECGVSDNLSSDRYLLLSLYHPTREEVMQGILEAPGTAYSLTRRSGHAASPAVSNFRRYDVWMLEEGSIFRAKPAGDVVRVLERSDLVPHNVYRCGRAFCIPIQSKTV
ncbi:MAG: type III-A CRISPR-associated RAMP protein Csm4 [Deltaproteobacteria bacterium]|nr:type III-A CRISPR-associated RAMP protein Csm4 [Deltaproteobacteria bacterium]MBW2020961.1 type III-A CRISPR-associated RAMP protein Csm4 [Deltaproteobacteria bacterium]MBW2098669.1 type III-A CRISPR-associated RAMP protein Csm4 [Deltaproteobacteria bacterium]